MRRRYLADAWYYIALLDRGDSHHARALRIHARIRPDDLFTHEAVLTEVLAYFSADSAATRLRVSAFVRELIGGGTVIATDTALFRRGLDLYARRPDKEYSLVDCMSMELMRERGITHVLTNDHHFSQEGFTVLSDAS